MVGTSFQTANFRREGQDNNYWMKVTISFASFSGILDAVASDIVNGLHFCQCAGYSIPTVTNLSNFSQTMPSYKPYKCSFYIKIAAMHIKYSSNFEQLSSLLLAACLHS